MRRCQRLESVRCVAVLDLAIENLSLLKDLPENEDVDLVKQLDKFKNTKAFETIESLYEIEQEAARLNALKFRTSLDTVENAIKRKTLAVVRALQKDEKARQIIAKSASINRSIVEEKEDLDPSDLTPIQILCELLTETESITTDAITSSVEDVASYEEICKLRKTSCESMAKERIQAEGRLAHLKERNKEEISELDEIIEKLKNHISDYQERVNQEQKSRDEEYASRSSSIGNQNQETTKSLQEQHQKVTEDLAKSRQVSKDIEDSLNIQISRATKNTNLMIENYDKEMLEQRRKFDNLAAQYAAERKRYVELQDFFDKIDDETNRIKNEDLQFRKFVHGEKALMRKHARAALVLQKFARAHKPAKASGKSKKK